MSTQMFSGESLDKAIDAVLPEIPEGHTHAVVLTADTAGVKLAVAFHNESDVWQMKGYAEHDYDGENKLGAELLLSW